MDPNKALRPPPRRTSSEGQGTGTGGSSSSGSSSRSNSCTKAGTGSHAHIPQTQTGRDHPPPAGDDNDSCGDGTGGELGGGGRRWSGRSIGRWASGDVEAPISFGETEEFSYESMKESGWSRPSSMSRGESSMMRGWAMQAQESDDDEHPAAAARGGGRDRRKSVELRAGELVPPVGVLHYAADKNVEGSGEVSPVAPARVSVTPNSALASLFSPPLINGTPGLPTANRASTRFPASVPPSSLPPSSSRPPSSSINRRPASSNKVKQPSNPKDWPCCTEEALKERPYRRVLINAEEQEFSFGSNLIITSKYTLFSFLPLFLFASFHPKRKMANLYFLLLSIFQCVPQISNTYGVPTILLPLSFVIFVDAVFAALEDIRRHRADQAANSSPCLIWNPTTHEFHQRAWVDIQVGDFLKVQNREVVPSDLVLLAVHEPDPAQPDGICYLETKSLDGETNLKLRETVESTRGKISTGADVAKLRGLVEMEHPNKLIDSFTGTLELYHTTGNWHVKEAIEPTSILLRGCTIRNTDWVVGLVVNTGNDTKIMMSNVDPPLKLSSMTYLINMEIRRVVLLLVVVCCIGATGFLVRQNLYNKSDWYLHYGPDEVANGAVQGVGNWVTQFAYFFLLCGNFIPVSLYVSMSTVRFFQSYFMEWDLGMYHAATDNHAEVRTMNLNEELGQISHVFTDKTGTLTCNVMEFRKCSVGGYSYGLGVTEISKSYKKMTGLALTAEEAMAESEGKKGKVDHVNFYDPSLWDDLQRERRGEAQQKKLQAFFRLLAVCHSVIPEKNEGTGETKFSASSPDDEALVCAARFFGYAFEGRRDGSALVRNMQRDVVEGYRVLEILEFTSARKRMSVIVEAVEDGQILVLAKGADTAMGPRLRPGQDALLETTLDHMKRYASEGLRTLMICSASMTKEAFGRWYLEFERAAKDLAQIELRKSGKDNQIDVMMAKIENNFELLGATAIEDKLQEGVPEAIHDLSRAGIKVWMLTGDKEETAVNIGVACNLLEHSTKMRRITINTTKCQNEHQVRYLLKHELQKFKEDYEKHHEKCKPRALIIDGPTLMLASKEGVRRRLLKLTRICKSVVACRVSPDQKRSIVNLVKNNEPNCRAMSIGDGANDVPMIQEAHIGVGIAGMEGMQAVNASDYSISQFRFLRSLLLVHGRYNYRRMAFIVAYIFYKNIFQAVAQFFFAFCNSFSGQKYFTEGSIQLYNVLFTTLPLLLLGIWDRDVSYDTALKYPELYIPGIHSRCLTSRSFWSWIAVAMAESSLCTLYPLFALRNHTVNEPGQAFSSFWETGAITYTLIILVVTFKIGFRQEIWTKWNVLAYIFSLLAWFVVAIAISFILGIDSNWYQLFPTVMSSWAPWLCILVVTAMIEAPDLFMLAYERTFHPSLVHVLQARERGVLPDSPSLQLALKDMQQHELKAHSVGGATGGPPPAVTPASGGTPIEVMRRMTGADGSLLGGGRKPAGFAFSADPITLEAERRMIMSRSVRMAPIRDILEELENMDDNDWPEGMLPPPVERMDSTDALDDSEPPPPSSSSSSNPAASGVSPSTTTSPSSPLPSPSSSSSMHHTHANTSDMGKGGRGPASPRVWTEFAATGNRIVEGQQEEGEEEEGGEGGVTNPPPSLPPTGDSFGSINNTSQRRGNAAPSPSFSSSTSASSSFSFPPSSDGASAMAAMFLCNPERREGGREGGLNATLSSSSSSSASHSRRAGGGDMAVLTREEEDGGEDGGEEGKK